MIDENNLWIVAMFVVFGIVPPAMRLGEHIACYLLNRNKDSKERYDYHNYGFNNLLFTWPEQLYGKVKNIINSYSKKKNNYYEKI